mmetsp:Transcript_25101/g.70117  ORF Transcript_25101/g.70117 Transcript_25101/m.70117 type:complete len:370 (-) Transcript_25101:2325-3434(-)
MLAHTQVHWLPASVASTIRSPILSPPNPMQTQTLQRMAAALAPIPAPVSSTATGRCGALPVLRGTCHVAKGRRSAAHPFALISSLRHSHRRTHGRHPWGPKSAGAVIRPRGVCTAAAELDRTIEIKLMIAKGTDKLDLTDLNKPLGEIPQEVFELNQLKELSLAGNQLTSIPPEIAMLQNLERLQVAGNRLESLPEEIGLLENLEGVWAHGNLLRSLPDSICKLSNLRVLSLAGNCLRELPRGVGNLTALEELGLPGNQLACLPESIGSLKSLQKLSLHGNCLEALPASIGNLLALKELWLMVSSCCMSTLAPLKTVLRCCPHDCAAIPMCSTCSILFWLSARPCLYLRANTACRSIRCRQSLYLTAGE